MATFPERWSSHLRLAILLELTGGKPEESVRLGALRVLRSTPGLGATASLIQDGLTDFGLSLTRDQVHSLIRWLAEQRLVVEQSDDAVVGAMLTQRGREVAEGAAQAAGVGALPTIAWLQTRLDGMMLRASMSEVVDHLWWLEEEKLVTYGGDNPQSNSEVLVFATIRGRDVAAGREVVDGVKQASPDTILRTAANAAKSILR